LVARQPLLQFRQGGGVEAALAGSQPAQMAALKRLRNFLAAVEFQPAQAIGEPLVQAVGPCRLLAGPAAARADKGYGRAMASGQAPRRLP
jgi:hypothetical protein